MTAAELAARLEAVPPADVPALRLDADLKDLETANRYQALIERMSEVEAAVTHLNQMTQQTERTIQLCSQLPPLPSRHLPLGF